jgi:hypothetical protein
MPQRRPPGHNASKAELARYAEYMRERQERASLEAFIRTIVQDELRKYERASRNDRRVR